jgi:hypothetical protein
MFEDLIARERVRQLQQEAAQHRLVQRARRSSSRRRKLR